MKFLSNILQSSPHSNRALTTSQVMRTVCYATAPAILTQMYWFGWGVLIQLILCIGTALLAEAFILSMREKNVRITLADGSAMLTGLLIAVSIPPLAPWWIAVIGSAFAIIFVKQLYGGLGFNLFNPAMAAYVLLLVSFPVAMTSWLPPSELMSFNLSFIDALSVIFTDFSVDGYSLVQLAMGADGASMATPLDHFKTQVNLGRTATEISQSSVFSSFGGLGWQYINLAYLFGGIYLIFRGIIRWHIPVAMIVTLFLLAFLDNAVNPDMTMSPISQLFVGATMIGAFFIATDPVSASTTKKGRLLFGALIGLIVFVIRKWGGYPDAMAFAVLLANICVPLIDYYTKPLAYGHRGQQ